MPQDDRVLSAGDLVLVLVSVFICERGWARGGGRGGGHACPCAERWEVIARLRGQFLASGVTPGWGAPPPGWDVLSATW